MEEAAEEEKDSPSIRRGLTSKVQFAHTNDEDDIESNKKLPLRRRTLSESSYFSGASSIMSSTSSLSNPNEGHESEAYHSYRAPDGGWGWVVVIASFMVNLIADGVTFSFGVLFDELQKEFGESKAVTAGVVSVFHAVPLLSGPVASALTDR